MKVQSYTFFSFLEEIKFLLILKHDGKVMGILLFIY